MFFPADNEAFVYCGRIDEENPKEPVFIFPGTYVTARFTGTSVHARLRTIGGDWRYFLGIFIDGKQTKLELTPDGQPHTVLLAEGLTEGEHELLLFKRQDACCYIAFGGLLLDEGARLLPGRPLPDRKMEVFGDSISCGEVIEAVDFTEKEDPENRGEYSNAWYSYSWQTARRLSARVHISSISGIALLDGTGWYNEEDDIGTNAQGMESCFDKLECNRLYGEMKTWDFKKYVPQVVIIAIGQNDAHPIDYMASDYCSSPAITWRERYFTFVTHLMDVYPGATFILTTTILEHDLSWDKAITETYQKIKQIPGKGNRVHRFFYSRTACGTPGHVRISEAEEMAEELAAFLGRMGERIWA